MPNLAPVLLVLLALSDDPPVPVPAPAPTPLDVVSALETTLADAIARAEPSVVAIARDKDGRSETTSAIRGKNPAPLPVVDQQIPFGAFRVEEPEIPDYVSSDYGSGVVIGEKGEILTTFHVVKGASRLLVRAQGVREFDAEVIASDPRSDLAVIAPRVIPGVPPPKLKPIKMGDASKLRKGTFLLSLGNPFNAGRDGRASASWGILSNISRRLDLPSAFQEPYKKQLKNYPTLLQLDAKLNLGMSGGAVINLKGELVGLTTNAANAGGFDAQAGYALPLDALGRRAIESLKEGREVEYGFLGVQLPRDNSNRIAEVQAGTPAGEGGLEQGDEIISIGGLPVVDSDTLVMAVNAFRPGTPILLKVVREGVTKEKTVVLSKLRVFGEVIATNRPPAWRGLRVDYLSTDNRMVNGPALLQVMARGGVVVSEVQPGSPAEESGIKLGQILVGVEETRIKNPVDFAKAVENLKGSVRMTLEGDRSITIR